LISKIVEILKNKTIDEIYGDLESYSDDIVEDYDEPYNITYIVIHQIEILGKRFECVNLMYLLIARDYVYRFYSNNEDKLNFPELSTLELSNILEMYLPKIQAYNKLTLYIYQDVMKLTNNNEKSDNAQKKYDAQFQ